MAAVVASGDEPTEIVNVPVPREFLGVVYAALGAAMAGDTPSPTPAGVVVNERSGVWTEEMIRQLQRSLPYPGVEALIDLCAARAPADVTLEEVASQSGIAITKIRGQLGAFAKLCMRLFDRDTWPFDVRDSTQGRGIYSMKPQIATWWLAAK